MGNSREHGDMQPTEASAGRVDGGGAFPHDNFERARSEGGWTGISTGMSLRDYFAGQALVGMLSGGLVTSPNDDETEGLAKVDDMAASAYTFADAMLAARKVQP